jgi:predicted enzyme related to lactoylglutathione lyase
VNKLGLVLDCADPDRLAEFWAAALGYTHVGAAGSYVLLVSSEPGAPKLLLQRVPEPKSGKNRMHLDIEVPDIEAEARRLVGLGATRIADEPLAEHGTTWVLMSDPEGNEFCVCDGGEPA